MKRMIQEAKSTPRPKKSDRLVTQDVTEEKNLQNQKVSIEPLESPHHLLNDNLTKAKLSKTYNMTLPFSGYQTYRIKTDELSKKRP